MGNHLAFVKHSENNIYINYVFLNDTETCPCVLKLYVKSVIFFMIFLKVRFLISIEGKEKLHRKFLYNETVNKKVKNFLLISMPLDY